MGVSLGRVQEALGAGRKEGVDRERELGKPGPDFPCSPNILYVHSGTVLTGIHTLSWAQSLCFPNSRTQESDRFTYPGIPLYLNSLPNSGIKGIKIVRVIYTLDFRRKKNTLRCKIKHFLIPNEPIFYKKYI